MFLDFIRHSIKGLARWNLLVLMGWGPSLLAQSTFPTQAESLTDRQGLPQAFVPDITQDRQGFIWMATRDGLCRYDGNRFRVFQPGSDGKLSLASAGLVNVKPDENGRLWVASEGGDLDVLDPLTERITPFSRQPFYRRHFGRKDLVQYDPGRQNRLWLTFSKPGLACVDLRTRRVRWYRHQPHDTGYALSGDSVSAVREDPRGMVWIGTNAGLNRLDLRSGRIRQYHHEAGNPSSIPDDVLHHVHLCRNGDVLLISRRHVTLFNPQTGRCRIFPITEPGEGPPRSIQTATDSRGDVYFNYFDRLLRFNERQGVQVMLRPDWECQSVFVDRSDVLWIGTDGAGVRKFNLRANPFQTQPYQRKFIEDLLRNFLKVPPEELSKHDFKKSGYSFRYTSDGAGRIWFSVGSGPFYRLDPKTGRIEIIPLPALPRKNPASREWDVLSTDSQGVVWAFCDGTAARYEDSARRWVPVPPRVELPSVVLQAVVDERAFWLATATEGLYRVDRRTGQVRRFRHQPRDPRSLSSNALYCLSADPTDPQRLWVGTFGSGLCAFDKQTGTSRRVTVAEGLPNNVIYFALPDHRGFLWLGTNQGLCRFDRRTFQTQTYTTRDGLLADEFNRFHFLYLPGPVRRGRDATPPASQSDGTADDRILAGGLEGITAFYPDRIQPDTYQPAVELTGLQLNNRPLEPGPDSPTGERPAQAVTALDLPHDQNFLTVEFAALQFNKGGKNRYRHRLEGLDADWVETDQPLAVYTSLQPGHYRLRLNASNTSGVWSQRERTLSVRIRPPLWARWWAYVGYALVLGGIALLLGRSYRNRLRLRRAVASQQREAEQLRVLDELKTRFFANITHDFRTPLTLILTPAQRLKPTLTQPDQQRWVGAIERNAHQLLHLINQLLDLSKLDAQGLSLHESRGRVSDFIAQEIQAFDEAARTKNLSLSYQAGAPGEYWFDGEKLERIVSNLVSNALKFTPGGGRVEVSLRALEAQGGIELCVNDTGRGIPPEQVARIFDRFYQVDDRRPSGEPGTGIGLALVRELVELQGGTIAVLSRVGQGSIFTVHLPYRLAEVASASAPVENAAPAPTEAISAEAPVVLLVEDNPELSDFIAESLPPSYRIHRAVDGSEGLARALDLVPDLIISDVMMPGMDGFALTERLKADERTSHVPIILLTAKAALDSRVRGLSAGADDYLAKPFHLPELQLRVRNLLERQRRLREQVRAELTRPGAPPVAEEALPTDPFLHRLQVILERNLDDSSFGPENLAAEAHLSRMHLHRKLKALSGLSATEFIRSFRLQRATLLLAKGQPVSETAYRVGFESPQYFSRCFREAYGVTPSEWAETA